jgi:hypothetical protein
VDFLGSITGTTNVTTGAIVNTYRTKPYGAKLSGGTIGLRFFWTGNTGSRSTGRQFAEQYNRARHYSSVTGQWTTRDGLWPSESAYGYVRAIVTTSLDPSGASGIRRAGIAVQLAKAAACCKLQTYPAVAAAKDFCDKYFPGTFKEDFPGWSKDTCNAMQHCMLACLVAQKCGNSAFDGEEIALACTDLHEEDAPKIFGCSVPGMRPVPDPYYPNPPDQKCMDLYNNRIGINCSSAASCEKCCLANVKSGAVQVVWPPKKLPPGWRPAKSDCRTNRGKVKMPRLDYLEPWN